MEKFRKKKDDEEKKRLEEAYVEFRDTFEDDGTPKLKTFIRTDIVNANSSTQATPAVYKPQPIQLKPALPTPTLEQKKLKAQDTAKKIMQEAQKNKVIPPSRPPKPGTQKLTEKSKMSNLEAFKEELKQVQALRDERKGLRRDLQEKLGVDGDTLDKIAPAFDSPFANPNTEFENDPSTTNLYICNIPKETKMEDLFETFGTFGPLASARILYPRPEDERPREFLCGFVAYMSRVDAERALLIMTGEKLRGSELRCSWARPVAIPPVPFYVPPALRDLAIPDMPTGLPFNAKPLSEELREFLQRYGNLPRLGAQPSEMDEEMLDDYKKMLANSTVRVVIPTEKPLLTLIHKVVEFLVRNGPKFEALIMARERSNPVYRFLFDNHHPTHVYYRWRLFSILQGEDRHKWRLEKFRVFDNGSWWQPPPHSLFEYGMPPILYDTAYVSKKRKEIDKRIVRKQSTRGSSSSGSKSGGSSPNRKERRKARLLEQKTRQRGILDDDDRNKLEDILRSLLPEKTGIGDAMCWCCEHADCSKEIVQCVYESLCIKETPLHKKIARVYLISDILLNCSARIRDLRHGSDRFLPVFYFRQHFSDVLLKIFVELNAALESIESMLKAEQFRQRVMLCFRCWEENSIYPTDFLINLQNVFLGLVKPSNEPDTSIDGEPLADDAEDVDGEPLLDDPDLDGIPLAEVDENIDGVPIIDNRSKMDDTLKTGTFKTSSWSTVETPVEESTSSQSKSNWETVGLTRWERSEIASAFNDDDDHDDGKLPVMSTSRHRALHHSIKSDYEKKNAAEKMESDSKGKNGSIKISISLNKREEDEERRKALREVEVKVMKYQDELESKGAQNFDEDVSKFRKKLVAKVEQELSAQKEKFSEKGTKRSRRSRSRGSSNGSKDIKKKRSSPTTSSSDRHRESDGKSDKDHKDRSFRRDRGRRSQSRGRDRNKARRRSGRSEKGRSRSRSSENRRHR